MTPSVSHSWDEETPEAKARWFASLSDEERIAVFCEMTELILQNNPHIADQKDADALAKGARILSMH